MYVRLDASDSMLVLLDLKLAREADSKLEEWKVPAESYVYYSLDVTDSATLTRVVDTAFDRCPMMDTVLGHAGGCGLHPFASTTEAEFERIFRFNFFAQTYLARTVFAQWIARKIPGHLIFTSSYVARVPHTLIPSYASAKAALENFARCMALEYVSSRNSRERDIARKRRGWRFAQSVRGGPSVPRVRVAGFPREEEQPGIHRRCVRVPVFAAGIGNQRTNTQR